jgi:hypothetical protein
MKGTSTDVYGAAGNNNTFFFGYVDINVRGPTVSFSFLLNDADTPASLTIDGPVDDDAPLVASDTYWPDSTADDFNVTISDDGYIADSTRTTKDKIITFLANPTLYYVILKTGTYPDGAAAARFLGECPPYVG